MAMDKRTRAARDYGRAIDWLAAHAPALAVPVATYVAVLRDECARLRTENVALRAAAGDPEAIAATGEAGPPMTVPGPTVDIVARASELLELQRAQQRARTWLPTAGVSR